MPLSVALVSPERILYQGEADMVVCRTTEGEIAFLAGHAPFVGLLAIGKVKVVPPDGPAVRAAVHGGFVEVRDNRVSLLSDVAELADQIDLERARVALDAAQRRIQQGEDGESDAALRRATVRLEVAGEA